MTKRQKLKTGGEKIVAGLKDAVEHAKRTVTGGNPATIAGMIERLQHGTGPLSLEFRQSVALRLRALELDARRAESSARQIKDLKELLEERHAEILHVVTQAAKVNREADSVTRTPGSDSPGAHLAFRLGYTVGVTDAIKFICDSLGIFQPTPEQRTAHDRKNGGKERMVWQLVKEPPGPEVFASQDDGERL